MLVMESFVIIKAAILIRLVGYVYSGDGVAVAAGHAGVISKSNVTGRILKELKENNANEMDAYKELMKDPVAVDIVPKFYRIVTKGDTNYIELQDLRFNFTKPRYEMDVKLGTRTVQQSGSDPTPRDDLYYKMMDFDRNAPTKEEHEAKQVTKLRYLTIRDKATTSARYGLRITGTQMPGIGEKEKIKEREYYRKIATWEPLVSVIGSFFKFASKAILDQVVARLEDIKAVVQKSHVFSTHEVIGCSALIIYNEHKAGVWLIDFAKFSLLPNNMTIKHTEKWIMGNYEDGLLIGVDNLIKAIIEIASSTSSASGASAG